MAFKILIITALVACVSAGGPASYSISAPSADHYSVGTSNEHTVKGLYGQNVLSSYSKSVSTPHSHAQVSLSKASNDISPYVGYKAPLAYPGYAAPLAYPGYHAPLAVAKPALPYAGYYGAHYPAAYPAIAKPALAYPGAYPAGYPYGAYAHGAYAHGPVIAKAAAPVLGSTVSFHGLGAHYGW
uniref:CSON013995 protein n=1 Tax=Culicoides sonorensis TaxID=179676 RepID=A0A336MLN9_CULSO